MMVIRVFTLHFSGSVSVRGVTAGQLTWRKRNLVNPIGHFVVMSHGRRDSTLIKSILGHLESFFGRKKEG